jgi:uncharacterized protein (TIGR00159 family)
MLEMNLFGSILGKFIDVGFIALLIVFQQEIRRFLLFVGTNDIFSKGVFKKGLFDFKSQNDKNRTLDTNAIVTACKYMSETKTGALIVIAKSNDLNYYASTGDILEAKVSTRILESIFYKNSPLHDGAAIISKNIITGVRCVLPATEQDNFPANLGMRHRAAVGVTELTDSIAIIVSEQTGDISIAKGGELHKKSEKNELADFLLKEFN